MAYTCLLHNFLSTQEYRNTFADLQNTSIKRDTG